MVRFKKITFHLFYILLLFIKNLKKLKILIPKVRIVYNYCNRLGAKSNSRPNMNNIAPPIILQ